jgi:NAD(P)-dependent dehydrogenase (short-subunit alcohol dehydrogenase family)
MKDSGAARVAFITGASFGIGAATALALAREGYDIAVSATRLDNVANTAARVEEIGAKVCSVALDVRSQESIDAAYARVVERFGRVDVLVNNAGVPLRKAAIEISQDEWASVMQTNVDGTFFMSQAFARDLIAANRAGCVINIGSTHGLVGFAGRLVYGVSKAAIQHMTRMLAIEWAPHRIRVNAVAPGRVESDSPSRKAAAADPAYLDAARARIPLGRFCSVDDVAQAVRYLASADADYITGHVLVLDGGVTAA